MNSTLIQYVNELCDKYAHFGEFVKQEMIDAGVARYGKVVREGGVLASMIKVYRGEMGVGENVSAFLGQALNAPPNHYENLFKLFKAVKERRAKGV